MGSLADTSTRCVQALSALIALSASSTFNLNVKVDHEIRVKVDKELDNLFSDDSELF